MAAIPFVNGNAFPYAQANPTPFASGVTISSTADRILLLDEVGKDLESLRVMAGEIATDLQRIADSVFGTLPEAAQGVSQSPYGNGRADGIRQSLGYLHNVLAECRGQVERLRGI